MENLTAQNCAQTPPRTILLVEDFDDTRLMMKLWLAKEGYHVVEAESGEAAIRLARDQRPDLIIMDIMMPGMNRLHATHPIREPRARRTTPIRPAAAYG